MKKKADKHQRTCGDCIHESACFYAGGGCGNLTNTDATHCVNFVTLTDYLAKYAPLFGYVKTADKRGKRHEEGNDNPADDGGTVRAHVAR